MFNVNHFIVSQVNPHVVPFLVKGEDSITQEAHHSGSVLASGPSWLHGITDLAKGEALHRMHMIAELGIFPNTLTKTVSVLSQKYSGDITILPEISYADFPRMLSNPTTEFMTQAMLCGERATWPKLSRIRNHCAIELALDDAVQKLRTRVVFSPSKANLRPGLCPRSKSDASKRKRNRHQYKISQTSEPDALIGRGNHAGKTQRKRNFAGQPHQFNHVNVSNGYECYDKERGKLINGHDRRRAGLINDREHSEHRQHEPFPPEMSPAANPMFDILSSEAETCHTTSDAESETSSSTAESPYLLSPNKSTFGLHSRHLFPHASQPNTPVGDPFTYFSTFSTAKPSQTAASISGSPLAMASLSMTPYHLPKKNPKPSAPEVKYKRFLHNTAGQSRSGNYEPAIKPSEPKFKRNNALGLAIDISHASGAT